MTSLDAQASASSPAMQRPHRLDARIREFNGAATLFVNGEAMPFVAFKPTEHADEGLFDETVHRTVADMAASGVHVHFVPIYFGWDGPGAYAFGAADRRIRRVIEADPHARVIIRIQSASMSPAWWMRAHPDEVLKFGSDRGDAGPAAAHETAPVASLGSDFWTTHALDALRALAQHVQRQDYGRHVIGYLPTALNSNEWFIRSYHDLRVADFSPAMRTAFSNYLRDRFGIEGGDVPSRLDRGRGDRGFLLDPDPRRAASPVTAFYRFINDRCARAILAAVRTLRGAYGEDRPLVGVFYGYTMGLAYFHWLADSGHLAMAQLLEAEDGPDFVSSPLEYFTRNTREPGFGGFCWSQGAAADSARLAGNKAYFAEDDFCPPMANQPAGWSNAGDDREDVELLRRNFAFTLCKGNLQWWYDLNGHWFESPGRLEAVRQCTAISRDSLTRDRRGVAEVAVFLDEHAPQQVTLDREMQRALFWSGFFESFADIGTPVDLFMLSDLDRVDPARYLLMCFPTAFALDARRRAQIDALKRDGRTLIFCGPAGLIDLDGGGFDEQRLCEVVGMQVAVRDALHPLRLATCDNDPLVAGFEDRTFGVFTEKSPVFHVEDPDAQPLGFYTTRGPVGLAVRRHKDWTSLYCAVPALASAIVRNAARDAGVHLYLDEGGAVVYANASYLAMFPREGGRRAIHLPRETTVFDSFADRPVSDVESCRLSVDLPARQTQLWRLGT